MLYTINIGKADRPAGCQRTIVHLVSTVATAVNIGSDWAFSNGNAGAYHTDFFPWQAVKAIGCHNNQTADHVQNYLMACLLHRT